MAKLKARLRAQQLMRSNVMIRNNSTISRVYVLLSLALSIVILLSIVSCARDPDEKKYVVGIINPNPALTDIVNGFKAGMTDQGYVEEQNITYLSEKKDIDSTLRGFIDKKADLILTITTPATKTAQETVRGTDIPVVGFSYDPVRGGLVKSLIYKKDNITGVKVGGSVQKALEWLLLTVPDIKRLFVPVKFDTPATHLSLADLKKAAEILNIDLLISTVDTMDDLKTSLFSIPEDIDAIFILHSLFVVSNLEIVLDAAVKRGLPTASGSGLYKNGVTISYGQNHLKTGERASWLAHKILQGTPAFSLPFETADFYLGVNLISAQAAGLNIPEYILKQAYIVRAPESPKQKK